MKWWLQFGCFLTGWNRRILSQCSEASFKYLKKYTAALLILIILWGFTGFCFAQRYVHAPLWGCVFSSVIFIVIVIQIERQIILAVKTSKFIFAFRFFIAVIMAVLGSSILDQVIFGEDIKRKMVEITDRLVVELLPSRLRVIEDKLNELQQNIDSLESKTEMLNEEIAKEPVKKAVTTTTTYKNVQQEDGTYKKIPETTVASVLVSNPLTEQVKMNNLNLSRLRKQQDEFVQKKIGVEDNLRGELLTNVGFLEELNAMLEIILTRKEAMAFYIIISLFLLSLELFVVAGKLGDKKCDYELIIEHQLNVKATALNELVKNIH